MNALEKERTTICFDADVFDMVLAMRAKPEYRRMSISAIVNMLLATALSDEGKTMDEIREERK